MMKRIRTSTALLVFAALLIALSYERGKADQFVRQYNPFPVVKNGDTMTIPFYGGINDPKPSFVDLDGDGLVDLTIGEATGKLVFLKNFGTVSDPLFIPTDGRISGLNIGTWHTFADIDGDGDLDLFCDNRRAGASFCENVGTKFNYNFVLIDSNYGPPDTSFATEVNNTPGFADIDGDGDYDFFYGNTSGYLWFYRNNGTPTTPVFELVTEVYDSVFAYPGAGTSMAQSTENPQHGFSNIAFQDIDADGDLDLFWGDLFNTNMYVFMNYGDSAHSDLTWLTETYLPTTTTGYNHATFMDLDGDKDLDLLVGAANYSDIDNLLFFRNVGDTFTPSFTEVNRNYLTDIDVGSSCAPAFGDLDGDGDFDMLLGALHGRLVYYENVGTASSPSFMHVTDSFQNINVQANSAPTLGDIDGDGDLDLLIGTTLGRVQFWRNDGTPQSPSFALVDNFYQGIKTDTRAMPQLVDMNHDSLLDIVLGEWDFNSKANVRIYENIGTKFVPDYALVTGFLLKVPTTSREFTIPTVYDWDRDGRPDILLGLWKSGLKWYRSTADVGTFPDSLSLNPMPDTIPGWDEGYSLTASFVDIDNDGDADLFVGEEDGGLSFFENQQCCVGSTGDVNGSGDPLPTFEDLTYLIAYFFQGGPAPICMAEANMIGGGIEVNVLDALALVYYLFLDGAPPQVCN